MKAIVSDLKSIDETRQGEAFYMPEIDEVNDINLKRFYIESYRKSKPDITQHLFHP